ncbi:MAG: hypothetical protein JNM34_10670 [Chthonomonadaceae bacterium]|nr:hypothetical protein [Chthonomonadaceae bacterium]
MDAIGLFMLVLGAALGFGAEWLYDLFVSRRRAIGPDEEELRKENRKLTEANEKLTHDVASLNTLKMQLELSRSELDQVRGQLKEAGSGEGSQATDELRQAIVAKDQELADLRSELVIAKSKSEPEGHLAQVSMLQNQIQVHEQTIAEMKDERAGFAPVTKEDVDNLKAQVEQEKRRADQLASELQASLSRPSVDTSDEVEALNMRIRSHEQTIMDLEAKIRNSESGGGAAGFAVATQALRAEIERLHATMASKDEALLDADATLNRLRDMSSNYADEAASLKSMLAEAEERARKTTELEGRFAELRHDLAARDTQVQQAIAEAARLREELDHRPMQEDFEALLVRLNAAPSAEDFESVQSQLSEAQQQVSRLNSVLGERPTVEQFDALKDQLGTTRREVESLQSALEARPTSETVDSLQHKVDSYLSELTELRSTLEQRPTQDDLAEARQLIASREAKLTQVMEDLASRPSSEDVQRLQIELDQMSVLARNVEAVQQELNSKVQDVEHLSHQVAELESRLASAPKAEDLERLQASLREQTAVNSELNKALELLAAKPVEAPIAAAQTPSMPATLTEASEPAGDHDPMIQIRGIGHVFERKLYEAGVTRFSQLADMSPERVLEIIQPAEWQQVDPAEWIVEARRLSRRTAS